MNIHHVHEDGEHQFNRCSNPNCDVTIERIRKYSLLLTKEHKVLEKYEKAVQIHDTISKRRQSMDVSHLLLPGHTYNGIDSPKLRRFSVPSKARTESLKTRSASPSTLATLEESVPDQNVTHSPTSSSVLKQSLRKISMSPISFGRSPPLSRKLSSYSRLQSNSPDSQIQMPLSAISNRNPLSQRNFTPIPTTNRNSLSTSKREMTSQVPQESSPYNQRKMPSPKTSPYSHRKITEVSMEKINYASQMRKISEAMIPRHTNTIRQRCASLITLTTTENSENIRKISLSPTYQSNNLGRIRKLSRSWNNLRHIRSDEFKDSLPRTGSYTHLHQQTAKKEEKACKMIDPAVQKRQQEAKQKLENRKNLLNRLDGDIHKVNLMLRKMKCKSMPVLTENMPILTENVPIFTESMFFIMDPTTGILMEKIAGMENMNFGNIAMSKKRRRNDLSTSISLDLSL